MSVDVSPAPIAAPAPSRGDLRRRWLTVVLLVGFCAALVYGTWLAVDDMAAKPMAGTVTVDGAALHVANTSGYAWIDVRLVIDGAFAAPAVAGPVVSGGEFRVPLAVFTDPAGARPAAPREVSITITRVPRFPKVNRARTASGTWTLDPEQPGR